MLDQSSIIMTSFAVSVVLFFLYSCLYGIERKRYMLSWSLGWLLLVVSYGARLAMFSYQETPLLLTVNYLSTLGSAVLIYIGVNDFLERSVKWWAYFLGGNVLLFAGVQIFALPSWIYLLSAAIFVGLLYWGAGVAFIRTKKFLGPIGYLVGIAFILWGLGIFFYPVVEVSFPASVSVFHVFVGSIGLAAALSLITGYFQKIRTDLLEGQRKIDYLTKYDKLTGLYNRSYFEEILQFMNCKENLPISLVVGDLDGLKLSNDIFGHHKGDELLVEAATLLRKFFRKEDIIARWGGDEFVILLPKTEYQVAWQVVERVKECFGQITFEDIPVNISLGVATKGVVSEDMHSVFKRAEEEMYNNKLQENKNFRSRLIKFIVQELQKRGYQTTEHTKRLKKTAGDIGESLGLTKMQLSELSLVAELCDIGKIAVPDEIINKQGPLSPDEWAVVQGHCEAGYHIVRSCVDLSHIADAILYHHEWWNGKGYPLGLKGREIPLYSRIIAVAVAYDAMLEDRPYRQALGKCAALQELQRCSGTVFDPDIVSVFVEARDSDALCG
ncbi:bifunctional diguanylate cyclase/phosphohydrolase [Dethiobacter alkaliphilus]|uniref:Diguanylate cyclase and metal dependent phosphohydrolase n=1 Tax=Dethiobacter alkaliphilus AHT 1 TaxID=555088 RepID=C0GJJ5_DETAL|nr:HD domain-containing phosphohydrolase [Dethiobacter alkaliphilus]EEG76542.1 diguanylate cyclase and metal dependent phosphohydrolase [Dethiobacter alkaliphilus AHT 1]